MPDSRPFGKRSEAGGAIPIPSGGFVQGQGCGGVEQLGQMLAVWREIQLRESMASKVARDVSEEEGKKGKRPDTAGPDPYAAFFGEV